ncbi:uncharacterized protein LOC130501807 isoform X2 [Raphanus sativus]|uniref:Uncharacterized protein LOC130501807 isoform X2 n=1 Tax=Raphanus sativus TaxID=3726 RepID=A0A9W3CM51_RAPSA|nr:uncharacterized protein LOC130501807 isoform X2 [Raphanus sativus]
MGKEDERTEKAIRSLLKLPENRRCINCNSLGPQYVCSTFWTFVCINCSGIHREFTHRVKSISMAKFTAEEVSALRAGGNERARQIYFKEWDTKRDAYPDASNIFKLRDFIKSVYVDKRYSSESNDKISQQKPAVTEDFKESMKASANFLGSKSFHSIDKSETGGKSGNKSLKFYFEDKEPKQQQQQPQHVTHNPKSRGLPKSPIRFEIVDDRYRDDGSVKRYDARREPRGSSKSLDLSNNKETFGLPIVRHASELIGENHPRLRVEKVVKVEKEKDPVNNQLAASSSKMKSQGSLIDDVPVSEPCDDSISQGSNEVSTPQKRTEGPAPNSLEALLFGFSEDNYPAANLEIPAMPKTQDSVTSSVTEPTVSHAGSLELALIPPPAAADNLKDMNTTSAAEHNQVESSTPPKEPSDTSMEQSILCISNYAHGDHQEETNPNVRSALPEDLFSGGFSFASPQVHAQHHGMGYGMQYYQYPVATTGAYTYTSKPSNPFDLSYDDDTCPNQTPQYHSTAYVQGGGLPLVSVPRGVSDSSSMAADSFGLMMASQSPYYAPALSPTSPSFASNLSPGAYAGQQPHVNMSPSFRREEMNSMGNAETTYNAAHSYHQANFNGYPSSNPNAYISRGNPFD